jgi:hypothetical protein
MVTKSPTAPAPPDPVATAQAQAGINQNAAVTQANLNRIDQYTPQGNLTYSQNGTNPDGSPKYTQTQTLSPDEQAKYDSNNKVALALNGTAVDSIGRARDALSQPFSYAGMTPVTSSVDGGPIQSSLDYSHLAALPGVGDFSADAKRVSDSVYGQAASRLDPQWQQNQQDFASRMAAQGISENSDAYRRAFDNGARAKNDAYNQANYSAIQAGGAEQSRIFGLGLRARQQGQNEVDTQGTFANNAQGQKFTQGLDNANLGNSARRQEIEQAAYLRNQPLNEIATLLGTGPGVAKPDFSPVSQVGVAAPDYAGGVQSQYNQRMAQYNAQQQARSQALGQIFGTVGSVGSMVAMSDRRFKENIKRIGALVNGLATYAFNYIGDKAQQFGVMAQEVLPVMPEAVLHDADGYMYVDYGKVYA